jgi:hypothetical protein
MNDVVFEAAKVEQDFIPNKRLKKVFRKIISGVPFNSGAGAVLLPIFCYSKGRGACPKTCFATK